MTHLGFIIPAYTLAVGLPLIFAVNAWMRLRDAQGLSQAQTHGTLHTALVELLK